MDLMWRMSSVLSRFINLLYWGRSKSLPDQVSKKMFFCGMSYGIRAASWRASCWSLVEILMYAYFDMVSYLLWLTRLKLLKNKENILIRTNPQALRQTDLIPRSKQTVLKILKYSKNRLRLSIVADIILCNKADILTQRPHMPRSVRFAHQRCVFTS
jgi:hypothetical protein